MYIRVCTLSEQDRTYRRRRHSEIQTKKKSIQMKMYKYEMNEGGNYSLHIILFLLLTCVFFSCDGIRMRRCKVLCCSDECMSLVACSNDVLRMINRMRYSVVSGVREEGNYTFSALFGRRLNVGERVFALAMAWRAQTIYEIGKGISSALNGMAVNL